MNISQPVSAESARGVSTRRQLGFSPKNVGILYGQDSQLMPSGSQTSAVRCVRVCIRVCMYTEQEESRGGVYTQGPEKTQGSLVPQ